MEGPAVYIDSKISPKLICIHPNNLVFRIFASFIPPITKKYKQKFVDFLGPFLGLMILMGFLHYGSSLKKSKIKTGPTESLVSFSVIMPLLCYVLCKLGKSRVSFSEIVSLLGYSLYGHILTLLVSFLCFQERSNFFFFVCLTFFGGLSTLRIVLVLLKTIPIPVARLLICSIISVVNILFLIFLHFAYMHRTFVYAIN